MLNTVSVSSTAAPVVSRDAILTAAHPALEALARRLVWDSEDARDVLQLALADAWARRASLKDPRVAHAWLRRIVVHRAMSTLRRRRLWNVIGRLLLVEPEATPTPEDEVARTAHLAALAAALEQLPARQATAFSLRYLEGLSLDEVAFALDCERGTARTHLQRAVGALRLRGVLAQKTTARDGRGPEAAGETSRSNEHSEERTNK